MKKCFPILPRTGAYHLQHVLTNFIDYGMSYVDNEAQFRFPIAFQIIFALITMAMMYFLPESPRWVSFQRSSFDLG